MTDEDDESVAPSQRQDKFATSEHGSDDSTASEDGDSVHDIHEGMKKSPKVINTAKLPEKVENAGVVVALDYRLNPDVHTVVLYKGRKYNWQAKVNLHMHIIEHPYANVIEVIAFNTSNFVEAEHVYLSSSYVYQKLEDAVTSEKVELVAIEYQKLRISIPVLETIQDGLKHSSAATYILDRLHVATKPTFYVDIKDSEKSYRMSNNTTGPAAKFQSRHPSISDPSPINITDELKTVSLTMKKPDSVVPSIIKRFGKSTTLIGEATGVKTVKEDEVLHKIVASLNSVTLANQTKRILNRVSLLSRQGGSNLPINSTKRRGGVYHGSTVVSTAHLKSFAKFRNDNDLLQESLSFLHVSDMVALQTVCKRWHQVLSYSIRSTSVMVLTSRDYYLHSNLDRDCFLTRLDHQTLRQRRMNRLALSSLNNPHGYRQQHNVSEDEADDSLDHRRHSKDSADEEFIENFQLQHEMRYHSKNNALLLLPEVPQEAKPLRAPHRIVVREHFVHSSTVNRLLVSAAKHIVELRLHYVVLDRDALAHFSVLTGRLKVLILGNIKVDDRIIESAAANVAGETQAVSSGKAPNSTNSMVARPPTQSMPSPALKGNSLAAVRKTTTNAGQPASPSKGPVRNTVMQAPTVVTVPPVSIRKLRFLSGEDLKSILFSCGADLVHLEVSLSVGEIPLEIFRLVPKLLHFTALDSLLAPKVVSKPTEIEGNVLLHELVTSLKDIPMPDLLELINESENEAFMLTDRRGKIVAVNDAWERIFGHSRVDIVESGMEFLAGPLTDEDEFEVILQGLKNQLKPEEITAFLYSKDEHPVLVQVILLPNLSKWTGLPLSYDCLTTEFIGQMALEQEEAILSQNGVGSAPVRTKNKLKFEKGKRDWRTANRELSYHLLRFGVLSLPFVPFRPNNKDLRRQMMGDFR